MTLQALLFDVDGTLAETEETHRAAFNTAFKDHGLNWAWDREIYKRLLQVAGGKERMRHYAEQFAPETLAKLTSDVIADLHAQKTRIYNEMVVSGRLELRPGVADFIAAARQHGLRLAIATTTSQANVTTLLASTLGNEAFGWFEAIGAGEQAQNKKPAPDIYLWVLEQLRLPPEACLALEDSANGLRAALAAGVPTLVTPSYYTADDGFSGALDVLPDLTHADLDALVNGFAQPDHCA